MNEFILLLLDWSEVWALLLPITVLLIRRPLLPAYLKPICYYIYIALVLNLAADIIWKFKIVLNLKGILRDNPFLYNTHSIVRLVLFSIFFISLRQSFLPGLKKAIPFIFLLLVCVNFSLPRTFSGSFYERFTDFSSRTLALESALLLIYCLLYYFDAMQQELSVPFTKLPGFWVVTGLSIYVVINFPIFLFYKTITPAAEKLAIDIWNVHNISYIILCSFIAKSFYDAGNKRI